MLMLVIKRSKPRIWPLGDKAEQKSVNLTCWSQPKLISSKILFNVSRITCALLGWSAAKLTRRKPVFFFGYATGISLCFIATLHPRL